MKKNTKYNPVREAISIFGSQAAFAKKCGVRQPTVFRWLQKGIIPPKRVLLIENLTGIPRFKLNPQIYPEQNR